MLHFNNAGSALPPAPVVEAQLAHLRLEAEIGGYEAADRAAAQTEHAYDAVASLLGARPDEIAVVENATRAFDMAFYAFPFREGDRILCSEVEYASNYLAFLQVARRTGAVVEVVPSEADGTISIPALRAALARDDRARLVALTHVPTNGGLVNPAAEVGRACRAAGVPFLLDACQSAGQMPLHVDEIGCDVLSATARKFLRGPRGVGFLYVRRSLLDRLEPPSPTSTPPPGPAATASSGAPTRAVSRTGKATWRPRSASGWPSTMPWRSAFPRSATASPRWPRACGTACGRSRASTCATSAPHPCAIVTFDTSSRDPLEIRDTLRTRGINVSVTTVTSTRLDMEARGLEAMVRASVHYYNTEAEVDRFCAEVRRLV